MVPWALKGKEFALDIQLDSIPQLCFILDILTGVKMEPQSSFDLYLLDG